MRGLPLSARHFRAIAGGYGALVVALTVSCGRLGESVRAPCRRSAPPKPLARSGLLAVHAVFLGLSALFCSRAFLLTDLDSHAILTGDPALMNWQLQWAHSRFPGHALTPTGVMAIRCKQFHLPDL